MGPTTPQARTAVRGHGQPTVDHCKIGSSIRGFFRALVTDGNIPTNSDYDSNVVAHAARVWNFPNARALMEVVIPDFVQSSGAAGAITFLDGDLVKVVTVSGKEIFITMDDRGEIAFASSEEIHAQVGLVAT